MAKYILRLDDASEKRDITKWDRIEKLCDKYDVKPLVAVIPDNKDPDFMDYPVDRSFWDRVREWEKKGWVIGLHGFNHIFETKEHGINPINNYSEFAGLPQEVQKEKIMSGIKIFESHGIDPKVFVAPAHTFDDNTLTALKENTNIRIVSDVPASSYFSYMGLTFVPQQTGKARRLPFKVVTLCYHPNSMKASDYDYLESFINNNNFMPFPLEETKREPSLFDRMLMKAYYWRHR